MSRYRFAPESPVNEIILQKSAGGGVRAFLFANKDFDAKQLARVKNIIEANGWRSVATEYDGSACLEVRGPSKIADLESALRSSDFLKGIATVSGTADTKYTLKEKLKNNMLLAYGIITLSGDAGMVGYGALKKRLMPDEPSHAIGASVAYAAGSSMFTFFGRGDKSYHQARDISTKLREKLQTDGLTVHSNSALASFTKDERGNTLVNGASNFLHKHPSELGNLFTALAGVFMARDGFTSKMVDGKRKRETIDGLLGITTAASGITAALTEEKTPDPNKAPPATLVGKAWRWVETKPNRIAGWGYMLSTVFHGWVTAKELMGAQALYGETRVANTNNFFMRFTNGWKQKNLAYLTYGSRAMFVSFNIVAEIILLLSSKGHGQGVKSDKSISYTTYAIVADTILHQPLEMREALIKDYSRNFIARPDILGDKPDEAEAALRASVEKLASNPWVGIESVGTPNIPPAQPTRTVNWQEKAALQKQAAASITPAMG